MGKPLARAGGTTEASAARTPDHRQRPTAGRPHPPAPRERRLRPGRLPHRLRPPTGDLSPGARSAPAGTAPTRRPRPPPPHRSWPGSPRACAAPAHSTPGAPPPPAAPGLCASPPRELRDLQFRVRAEQQTPDWKTRYPVRSKVEGTSNEFAHGHGMRHCRYRGQPKTRLQQELTAVAVTHRTPQRPATG
ncbi:transposase [Streptomyces sp. MK5]|uniref:transposase n=1 Tax=Streptomyces sp. MK5 TaxID=3064253 RepID=UPI002740F5B1|nr:transposase [Streptomyces sp. MK5]